MKNYSFLRLFGQVSLFVLLISNMSILGSCDKKEVNSFLSDFKQIESSTERSFFLRYELNVDIGKDFNEEIYLSFENEKGEGIIIVDGVEYLGVDLNLPSHFSFCHKYIEYLPLTNGDHVVKVKLHSKVKADEYYIISYSDVANVNIPERINMPIFSQYYWINDHIDNFNNILVSELSDGVTVEQRGDCVQIRSLRSGKSGIAVKYNDTFGENLIVSYIYIGEYIRPEWINVSFEGDAISANEDITIYKDRIYVLEFTEIVQGISWNDLYKVDAIVEDNDRLSRDYIKIWSKDNSDKEESIFSVNNWESLIGVSSKKWFLKIDPNVKFEEFNLLFKLKTIPVWGEKIGEGSLIESLFGKEYEYNIRFVVI